MTGGSLPAMTWHEIMAYAHQGIELKQLPGIPVPQVRRSRLSPRSNRNPACRRPPPRPALLTRRGADILVRVERMMEDANRALGPTSTIGPVSPVRPANDKQAEAASGGDALASSLEGRAFGNRN